MGGFTGLWRGNSIYSLPRYAGLSTPETSLQPYSEASNATKRERQSKYPQGGLSKSESLQNKYQDGGCSNDQCENETRNHVVQKLVFRISVREIIETV